MKDSKSKALKSTLKSRGLKPHKMSSKFSNWLEKHTFVSEDKLSRKER